MKQTTIYLDMDGVIAHFEKAYRAMWHEYEFDRDRFHEAVLNRKIFETLDWMPNGEFLVNVLRSLEKEYDVTIEMLTSTGSKRTDMKVSGIEQKTKWLADHGIMWKANFVSSKPEKAKFATPTSILIDDSIGCIEPFIKAGGFGILYHDSFPNTSVFEIVNILKMLR